MSGFLPNSKYRNALPKQKPLTSLTTYKSNSVNSNPHLMVIDRNYILDKSTSEKFELTVPYDDIILDSTYLILTIKNKIQVYSFPNVILLHENSDYIIQTKRIKVVYDSYCKLLFVIVPSSNFIDFYEIPTPGTNTLKSFPKVSKVSPLIHGNRFLSTANVTDIEMVRKEHLKLNEINRLHVRVSSGASFDVSYELEKKSGLHDYSIFLTDLIEFSSESYKEFLNSKVLLQDYLIHSQVKEQTSPANPQLVSQGQDLPRKVSQEMKEDTPKMNPLSASNEPSGKLQQTESRRTSGGSTSDNKRNTSLFKHLGSRSLHTSHSITLLDKPNTSLSNESAGLYASSTHLAYSSSSYLYVVPYKVSHESFVPNSKNSAYDHKIDVTVGLTDFAITDKLLAYSTTMNKLNVKSILSDSIDYSFNLICKTNIVQFHPFVENLVVTADTSGISFFDLEKKQERTLKIDNEYIFNFDFEKEVGKSLIATGSRDKMVRIFDSRSGELLNSTETLRGCKPIFVGENYLLCSGFDQSTRELQLLDLRNFKEPVKKLSMDVSPSNFTLHYDQSSCIVYCSGRGDRFITPVEVSPTNLEALPRFEGVGTTLGVAFVPKVQVNVREVEMERCFRMTQSVIESVSFYAPRQKKEYFQDDLYAPFSSGYSMTVTEWYNNNGPERINPKVDLCPDGMKKVSSIEVEVRKQKYTLSSEREPSESERKEQLLQGMFNNAKQDEDNAPLPQDLLEGVDSDEWDD